jgi:hypothetical protein
MLYAAQTIGLPATSATSTAAQWWTIGLDSSSAEVFDVERLGGNGTTLGSNYNALDPAIAVNAAGDVLVGFSACRRST